MGTACGALRSVAWATTAGNSSRRFTSSRSSGARDTWSPPEPDAGSDPPALRRIPAIRVADDFHRFYHVHRVLESEAESFRLGLISATQNVIARSLDLIGVEAPERM